jgi:hypothetical protein
VKHASWAILAMLIGVGLMLLPLLFSFAPTKAVWTDADQVQYQKAAADLHAATYNRPQSQDGSASKGRGSGRYDPVAANAQYEAAKAQYDKQKARLDSAQSRQVWMTWGLRVLGISLAAVGVLGYVRSGAPRQEAPRRSLPRRLEGPPRNGPERQVGGSHSDPGS